MPVLCWFCKKNPQDPTKSVVVHLHKILDTSDESLYRGLVRKQAYAIKTTYEYRPVSIQVPRCIQCANAHAKADKDDNAREIGGIIVFFVVLAATIALLVWSHLAGGWLIGIVMAVFYVWLLILWGKSSSKKRIDDIKSLGIQLDTAYYDYPEIRKLINEGYKEGFSPTEKHR